MVQQNRPQAETLYGLPQPLQSGLYPPIIAKRDPTTADTGYSLGQQWVDKSNGNTFFLAEVSAGSATWNGVTAGSGSVNTINSLSPSGGNIIIAGTASQITASSSGHTVTLSLPNSLTVPGSLTTTTTLTVGTNETVGGTLGVTGATTLAATTIVGTTNINASGAAVSTIGTGGTGAVHIGNATGNTAVTGSLTASTTLTATSGNITATNGNLVLNSVGNKLVIKATSSATCSAGTFALAGTATTVVSNSAVTASSLVLLTTQALGTVSAASTLAVTAISAGVSFTVTPSQSTDTSTIAYLIIN
jgi:hypothetical protein